MKRIVITGLGMINALGHNVKESFKNIISAKTGVSNISLFDASKLAVNIAAEVKGFDESAILGKKEAKKADRFILLGVHAAKEALEDAQVLEGGLVAPSLANSFGVVSASGVGGLSNIEKNSISSKERSRVSPFFIPSALVNMLGGFASIAYNLKGPNLSSVTACSAGVHAISEAFKVISLGGAERMLVIGAESAICEVGIAGFASMKTLSRNNKAPQNASRPFDKERDGFVMGEGAGALVVESLESAQARGAHIYAEVIGFGESGDASHITTPTQEGPLRAMQAAFLMAQKRVPEALHIDYVNAHGTSTKVNDANETAALKTFFKGKQNIPPISSTKGQTGHCLGAAGVIEAIISIKAMQEGIMPPTINQKIKDEVCDLDYIANVARKKSLNIVMSNSFGFGGTNGVLLLKKF